MQNKIRQQLSAECPWRDTLHWFDTVSSTNMLAREMAQKGAEEGTVVIANHQTHGKGRMGRSFHSPAGQGIYLSIVLRPECKAESLMHLTCAVGVAVCDAIEQISGVRPGIKWINDLVLGNKKLGGILTELSVQNGMAEFAIVGIGINCLGRAEDFPPEIRDIATSLQAHLDTPVDTEVLVAAMIQNLWDMRNNLFSRNFMDVYRKDCITLGKEICILQNEQKFYGIAKDLTVDGELIAELSDGATKVVHHGEVSVRGMYGYIL